FCNSVSVQLAISSLRPRPTTPARFPYTTLFRSVNVVTDQETGAVTNTQTRPDGVKIVSVAQPGEAVTASVTLPGGVSEATVSIPDRKSTRLNSSHASISYAVCFLKQKRRVTRRD